VGGKIDELFFDFPVLEEFNLAEAFFKFLTTLPAGGKLLL
jgi:hypothetical protein